MKSFAVLLSCVAAALALPGDERQGHLRAENGAQAAARFRATLGVSADYKGCIIQIGALAENRYVLQQGEHLRWGVVENKIEDPWAAKLGAAKGLGHAAQAVFADRVVPYTDDKADVSVEYEETKGNGGSILLTIRPNKVGAGKLTTIQCFGLAADADQHYLGGHDGHGAGYADLNLAPKTDDRAAGMLQFWLRETTTHTAPKRKITIKGVQVFPPA